MVIFSVLFAMVSVVLALLFGVIAVKVGSKVVGFVLVIVGAAAGLHLGLYLLDEAPIGISEVDQAIFKIYPTAKSEYIGNPDDGITNFESIINHNVMSVYRMSMVMSPTQPD